MQSRLIQAGSSQVSVEIIITTEAGLNKNDVAYDTASLDLWYWRPGGTKQTITPVELTALTDAYDAGGIILIGDGAYRLDLPDAAVLAGAPRVVWGGSVPDGIIIGGMAQLTVHNPLNIPAAVNAGTIAELTGVPPASPSLEQAMALLYMMARNKIIVDDIGKEHVVHNDAGTPIAIAGFADTAGQYTREKLGAIP